MSSDSSGGGDTGTPGGEQQRRAADRHDEGDEVAEVDVVDRGRAVGAVLRRPGVAQPDLLLVVEPGLAVVGVRRVLIHWPKRARTRARYSAFGSPSDAFEK
jgi:hypothetical protein